MNVIVLQVTTLDNNTFPKCVFQIEPTIEQVDKALAEIFDPEEFESEEERKSLAANLATRWSYELNGTLYELVNVSFYSTSDLTGRAFCSC